MLCKYRLSFLIALLLLQLIGSQTVSAQQWKWAINATGNNQNSDADRDIAVDNNGTQFIAGYFTDTLKLGSFTLINPDNYYSDMFYAKIDSLGNVIWAKAFDLGSTYNESLGICLDDSSNIFITGSYNGKIFVSKYDSSGEIKWRSNILQKNFYGYGRDIAIDQNENVFLTGQRSGSAVVAKLNSDGMFQWSAEVQGCNSNGAWGNDLAVDRLGNCYMAGGFDCDSVKVGSTVLRRSGTWGARTFLVKYSPDGVVTWVNMPDGQTSNIPQVALTDSGYVILAGSFYSSQLIFSSKITVQSSYELSSYIAKYSSNGNIIWAKNGIKYESTPRDIVVDYDGNIYMGGTRFGNYGGTEMDFHLIKYNTNGDTVYTREVLTGSEYLYGIDIDNFGNSYMVGHANVKGIGVFGPGYINPYTAFVAKFNTGSATRKRPAKPLIQKTYIICSGSDVPELSALGDNISWYKDDLLQNLVASGNRYTPAISKTDTFYVTQTLNNIQSWPKQVILYMSALQNFSIEFRNDSLLAPKSANYTYQWYSDSTAIDTSMGGKQPGILPAHNGTYRVVVGDKICSREAIYQFAILPLEFLHFAANKDGASGLIHWEVSKDADIKNFVVEKSSDGIDFKPLSYINRGDNATTVFSYTDKELLYGNNYYRLNIFSAGGKITLSDVVVVTNQTNAILQIYPNPVRNDLRFLFIGKRLQGNYSIRIFGNDGKLFYNNWVTIRNAEAKEIKVNFLRAGIYHMELVDGKNRYSADFIKL